MGGRFVTFMTALIIVLLASSAAHITWMVVPLSTEQALLPVTVTPPSTPSQSDAQSLGRDIVARHLFGMAQAARSVDTAASIPETQLKLVLHGVMASSDPGTATAIASAERTGKRR